MYTKVKFRRVAWFNDGYGNRQRWESECLVLLKRDTRLINDRLKANLMPLFLKGSRLINVLLIRLALGRCLV